ncbi:phosphoadenosine phosphosulfate reductase [Parvibaculum indicum]|uniref:phosphoadenylyl-sulfate reductase n=1 Tax=Parvibaculum indicum TaxID=562969 RepID=UPI001FEBC047|nr:phosphoadenylyl-sulfate reductase [Parvibaculum indicum]NIJ40081.1 phosphoadenosine phosphosulfate reductase [Parvibaculum indicum]
MTALDLTRKSTGLTDRQAAVMDAEPVTSARLRELRDAYESLAPQDLLEVMIKSEFQGRIAAVSSFGAESAVLLHMISQIDPTTPVIFLNTGKLFGETLRYRDRLQEKLGLADLRAIGPHPDDLAAQDPNGGLWNANPDQCCHIRKVLPLERALKGVEMSITGRKRFQTSARSAMHKIEEEAIRGTGEAGAAKSGSLGTRFKLNPLADWDQEALEAYLDEYRLPRHPLVKDGYLSIGCMPCTERVPEGGSYRDGRWAGQDKDECGIHLPVTNTDGDGI